MSGRGYLWYGGISAAIFAEYFESSKYILVTPLVTGYSERYDSILIM